MTESAKLAAIFVSYSRFLEPGGGGVQICSREYIASLGAAGFELHFNAYDFTRGLVARIRGRLSPEVWHTKEPAGLFERVVGSIIETGAQHVFFDHTAFADLSRRLRMRFPNVGQILLSHGAEGFDFCIDQQTRRKTRTENRPRPVAERMLGRILLEQMEQRRWFNAVLTLSPFEVEIEKWLGSTKSLWLPRVISEVPLNGQPIDQRVGCVSTLDHTPNHEGLIDLFDQLQGNVPTEFRFRLVGAPSEKGNAIARRYSFVDYVGQLSNQDLRLEAATWCCFVHPLFLSAKGCSTKLAVALGWELPIATTEYGARGYRWNPRVLPLADSPVPLATLVLQRARRETFEAYRRETVQIGAMSPTISEIGAQIRQFLAT